MNKTLNIEFIINVLLIIAVVIAMIAAFLVAHDTVTIDAATTNWVSDTSSWLKGW